MLLRLPRPVARFRHARDAGGTDLLEYAGNYHERAATPGTDVAVAFAGAIAISLLRIGS